LGKISSAAVYGVHAYEAEIEVNGAGGDPTIAILWLPDGAAKEGRERVTTAIATSEYFWQRSQTHNQSRTGRYCGLRTPQPSS